jgi:hypothetical protein
MYDHGQLRMPRSNAHLPCNENKRPVQRLRMSITLFVHVIQIKGSIVLLLHHQFQDNTSNGVSVALISEIRTAAMFVKLAK